MISRRNRIKIDPVEIIEREKLILIRQYFITKRLVKAYSKYRKGKTTKQVKKT
jgi:hypothetical protein